MGFNPHKDWHSDIHDLSTNVRDASHVRISGTSSTLVVEPDIDSSEHEVSVPSGILSYEPEELVLVAMAGTLMSEISNVLSERGQRLRIPTAGSIGGAVATRRNGPFPIDNSALPNTVLALGVVACDGTLFRTGGPTVKNVSGFDLTKVLVGSWGLLGVIAQVTLRTEPIPRSSLWLEGPATNSTGNTDNTVNTENTVNTAVKSLFRPALVCEQMERTVVLLEGHPSDVAEEAAKLTGFHECEGLSGKDLVALSRPVALQAHVNPFVNEVVLRLRKEFDPANRLNRSLAREWNLTT